MTNWPQMTKELTEQLRNLRGGAFDIMKAFAGIAQAALAPKALDGKTKELIALGIAVAVRCGATTVSRSMSRQPWSKALLARK